MITYNITARTLRTVRTYITYVTYVTYVTWGWKPGIIVTVVWLSAGLLDNKRERYLENFGTIRSICWSEMISFITYHRVNINKHFAVVKDDQQQMTECILYSWLICTLHRPTDSHPASTQLCRHTLIGTGRHKHQDLATYRVDHKKISPVRNWRSTPPTSQVLPTSKSRDTKTRKDIKNPAQTNLDFVFKLKYQQPLASCHWKWRTR